MADRDLKRLSRRELLEMLIAQGRENERLQAEITKMKDQLNEREINLAHSGSIAEAALRLSGIFEAAQRASEQYLYNISRGEITSALIGEADDFVILDANGNSILPGSEPTAAALPEANVAAAEAPEAEATKKKKKKASTKPKDASINTKEIKKAVSAEKTKTVRKPQKAKDIKAENTSKGSKAENIKARLTSFLTKIRTFFQNLFRTVIHKISALAARFRRKK